MKRISGLYVYPVKSLGGIALTEARVGPRGLAYDRHWMLADMNGLFLSQRKVPEMALIQPSLEATKLVFTHRRSGAPALSVPLQPPNSETRIRARVWQDEMEALAYPDAVNDWFRDLLGVYCQLVYFPGQQIRPVTKGGGAGGTHTAFADSCPLLITGAEALKDLNRRLEQPIPMDRFRPNIVFEGGQAYEEEQWRAFTLGGHPMRGICACTRCSMINVNQASAAVNTAPLAALAKYRKGREGITFGLHATLPAGARPITLKIGDEVAVTA